MRYINFLIILLILTACCDDNIDCSEIDYPKLKIRFDSSSNNPFTTAEVNRSYVVVVDAISQTPVDTLHYLSTLDGGISVENEANVGRDVRDFEYMIHIEAYIMRISNITYQVSDEVKACDKCLVANSDVLVRTYYNFSYEYNGILMSNMQLIVRK